MIGGILSLAVAVFGLQVLFGKKPDSYYKFLVWLIFAPLLLAVGYSHALWFWLRLLLWLRILSALFVPFFVSALLRLMFPRAKWIQGLQTVIFQTLIYVVTFPFRFLWRTGRFAFQRERHAPRLEPYRPVVGGKPPIANERERAENQTNLFDW